jgi:CBS domain-containing protein
MRVKDLMCTSPACCTPETSLRDAARLMNECDCGAIPVVEADSGKMPIGVITDRDIVCRAVAQGRHPNQTTVAQCMSRPLATINEENSIEECCEAMEAGKVRRMLVVNDSGELCGIVSQADIALRLEPDFAAEVVRECSEPTLSPSLVG